MNPLTKAINDIKFSVPKEILDIAYSNDFGYVDTLESKLEQQIRNRVLVDTNLVSGVTIYVNMNNVKILEKDEYGGMVIEIPERSLDGRAILSVHSLVTNSSNENSKLDTAGAIGGCDNTSNSLLQEATKIMTNLDNSSIEVTANLEIIGERIIYIRDHISNIRTTAMRLVVENQRLLNNLPPRAYINFSLLVSYAIKADIYNRLIVKLDQGYIKTGHNLGIVKDIINEYADMNQLYHEYLTTTWTSVMFMSDSAEMNSYVTSLFGNNM